MNADVILKIIDKCKDILDKEYVRPEKPPKKSIYEILSKSKEINKINNIEVDENYNALNFEIKYKNELTGFLYLKNIEQWANNKEKFFIRYIGVNNKFGWGGFLYKHNNYSITLINSNKKPWIILINDNFIWYRRAPNSDEKIREEFVKFLYSTEK